MITSKEILDIASRLVAAQVQNGIVSLKELEGLLLDTAHMIARLDHQLASPLTNSEPKVPINESIQHDYIICLEDGKPLKMMKRHLKSVYNMTPAQYRAKWGLPAEYPMVAPAYALKRSSLAKNIGLGKKSRGRPRMIAA